MADKKTDYYSPTHPDLLPPGNRSISERGATLEGLEQLIFENADALDSEVGSYTGNERNLQRKNDLLSQYAAVEAQPEGPAPGSPESIEPIPEYLQPRQPSQPGMTPSSRTVTSREFAPEAEQFAKLNAQQTLKQITKVGERAALHRQTGRQISMQMAAIDQAKASGIDGLEDYMYSLEDAYAQADSDLASLRVNPNKWEQETPVLAQVLMAVAAGAAGFSAQGRGPNPVVQMIENAIDRDISAQEKNIALKIRKGKLGMDAAKQLGQVRLALSAAYTERALDGLDAIKLNSQTELSAMNAEAAANELGMSLTQKMTDFYNDRVQTTQTTYKNTTGAGEVGKWDDAVLGRSLVSGSAGIKDLTSMYSQFKGARIGDSTVASKLSSAAGAVGEFTGLGSTDMHEYSRQAEAKVLSIAAEFNKGRPTDKDFEAVRGLIPTAGISQADAAGRMAKLITRSFNNANATFNSMSPGDKRKSITAYKENLTEVSRFVQQHPEVKPLLEGKLKRIIEMGVQ